MSFEIKSKIALISGGASGIGLRCAKELLRNGLRGVTLADVNTTFGEQALQEIQSEFGPNKAVYIHTDVTKMQSYEEAFKKTIEVFKNIDILINNAGIFNDAIWEKEIAININGVVHGMLLGLEKYIPEHKTGPEGVIVNIASDLGIEPLKSMPVYSGTKSAVIGISKAFGDTVHYNRNKIKVLTLCPGPTDTSILDKERCGTLGPWYEEVFTTAYYDELQTQRPENVALALVQIIKNTKTGTVWVTKNGQEPYEHNMPSK